MRKREEILKDLISFNKDIEVLQSELSNYPWDVENPIIIVTNLDVYNVLSKFKTDNLNISRLEDWANAIECRDDIEFESENSKEVINQIANPTLYEQLSNARLNQLMQMIENT